MGLVNAVRTVMVDNNLGEEFESPAVRFGLDVLDYANGKISTNEAGEKEIIVGFDVGKVVMIIGKSGTAKTSLAMKAAGNIIKPYGDLGFIQHQDFERSTSDERIMNLLHFQTKEEMREKYIHPTRNINTENTFNLIKEIVAIKTCEAEVNKLRGDNKKKFENPYMVPHSNKPGMEMLVPTPVIIDSLATMMPKKVDEDQNIQGNMSAAAVAKVNTSFFKGLLGEYIDGALLPIIINHITTRINLNAFIPQAAELNYLKQDESLPGLIPV